MLLYIRHGKNLLQTVGDIPSELYRPHSFATDRLVSAV